MTLYALDQDLLIFAPDASSTHVYVCPECFQPVRKRAPKNRFPHFYHLQAEKKCRLSNKSDAHLFLQIQLFQSIGPSQIQMERRFTDLGRIADLCWEKEKLIFEIQCSPISLEETEERIQDYKQAGYRVIWLLHDRIYNRYFLRKEELFLRQKSAAYYFHFQKNHSLIYDQFELLIKGQRLKRSTRLPIDLRRPLLLAQNTPFSEELPKQVFPPSGLYFAGDRTDVAMQKASSFAFKLILQNWKKIEEEQGVFPTIPSKWKQGWLKTVYWPYLRLLERLHQNWK